MTDYVMETTITGTTDALDALKSLDRNAAGEWHLTVREDMPYSHELTGAEITHDVLEALISGQAVTVRIDPFDENDLKLVVLIGAETYSARLVGAAKVRRAEIAEIEGLLVLDPWGSAPEASGF